MIESPFSLGPEGLTQGGLRRQALSNVLCSLTHSDVTGTLTNDPDTLIPTVVQNAYSQGLIDAEVIGVAFAPTTSTSDTNGVITFGGVDSDYYTGDIAYV